MSGGSMNYLYSKLEYDANFDMDTPERRAFAKHLKLVAKALHDIEWVDSGDYGPGGDTEAIRACLSSGATLNETVQPADRGSELSEVLGISATIHAQTGADSERIDGQGSARAVGSTALARSAGRPDRGADAG